MLHQNGRENAAKRRTAAGERSSRTEVRRETPGHGRQGRVGSGSGPEHGWRLREREREAPKRTQAARHPAGMSEGRTRTTGKSLELSDDNDRKRSRRTELKQK